MSKEQEPLVSICVLTYQHENYIRQALDSFLAQRTDFPCEIVVHDDASTDATQQILREYAEKYPGKFNLLLQTENQYAKGIINVSGAYNFPRARGKYIAFCDGDDFWSDPYKLQKQVDYMEAHPECSLCFHGIHEVDAEGRRLGRFFPYSKSRAVSAAEVIRAPRVFPFLSYLFRTELVRELPAFYHSCGIGDLPLALYLAAKGTAYYLAEPMACYRKWSSGSWSSAMWTGEGYLERLRAHIQDLDELYQGFDAWSKGQFSEAVTFARRRLLFQYAMGSENFREMLRRDYRPYFRALPLVAQLGAVVGVFCPGLYRRLRPKRG